MNSEGNLKWGVVWIACLAATIVGANWAIRTFGMAPVGFGLMAPAGVYFAGLAFTFRDLVHDTLGRWGALAAIALGAALSWSIEPTFAVASAAAFLFSELADLFVYAPLRERHWLGAVAASNVVGLIVDSALFLLLAFGSLQFLAGQIVGKFWVTAVFVAILWGVRSAVPERMHESGTPA